VLFSVAGEVMAVDGRRRFVPKSTPHLNACIGRVPLGRKVRATFSEYVYMRSESQLGYHWVLVGYVAEHTGHTKEEVHDAIMRIVFGEKQIELAGRKVAIRKSMAEGGGLTKAECVEVIDYDLDLCHRLDIIVPTREELGYLPG